MARKIKDVNAPKRPLSSFLLFGKYLRETREEIKKLPIKEQAIAISQEWKDATEDKKEEFKKKAAMFKVEYDIERQKYEDKKNDESKAMGHQNGEKNGKSTPRKRNPPKLSGYSLFISMNRNNHSEDENDPELAGKGHMAVCGIKWSRLSKEEKDEYNEKAAKIQSEKEKNAEQLSAQKIQETIKIDNNSDPAQELNKENN